MHPETHPTIEPSGLGLCETCDKRPATELDLFKEPICLVCIENANEAAWVRSNEESQ